MTTNGKLVRLLRAIFQSRESSDNIPPAGPPRGFTIDRERAIRRRLADRHITAQGLGPHYRADVAWLLAERTRLREEVRAIERKCGTD